MNQNHGGTCHHYWDQLLRKKEFWNVYLKPSWSRFDWFMKKKLLKTKIEPKFEKKVLVNLSQLCHILNYLHLDFLVDMLSSIFSCINLNIFIFLLNCTWAYGRWCKKVWQGLLPLHCYINLCRRRSCRVIRVFHAASSISLLDSYHVLRAWNVLGILLPTNEKEDAV